MSKVIIEKDYYRWIGKREDRRIPYNAGFEAIKVGQCRYWITYDPWIAHQVDPNVGFFNRTLELSHSVDVGVEIEMGMHHLIPKSVTLKSFQYVPAWAAVLNQDYHSLNGDDPGVGKSYEALLTLKALWDDEVKFDYEHDCYFADSSYRTLILCPPKKVFDWERDCKLWKIEATCISISSWSLWDEEKRVGIALMHDCAILDEVHYLKDPAALRTQNTLPWFEFFKYSVSLSGSFPPNYNHELWAYCKAAMPSVTQGLGYKQFAKKYCVVIDPNEDGEDWWVKENRNEAELYFRLRTSGMVRRTFDECHPDVPLPKIEMVKHKGLAFTKVCEEEMHDIVAAGYKPASQEKIPQEVLARTRKEMANLKVNRNINLVGKYLAEHPGHQIIILGHHRDALIALHKKLSKWYGCAIIIGGLASKKAYQIKEDFQAGKIQIVVGNFTSMGICLDFTRASYVLISEPDYTPDKHHQGIGRARRFGQTKQVLVQFSVVDGSYDCRVLDTALSKGQGIKRTLDGTGDEQWRNM